MKKTEFFEAMENISENKLKEADEAMKKTKKVNWMPYAAAAACAAVVIGIGVPMMKNGSFSESDTIYEQDKEKNNVVINSSDEVKNGVTDTAVKEYAANKNKIVVNEAKGQFSADMDVQITNYSGKIPESVWNQMLAEFGERIGTEYYDFIAKLPDTWGFPRFYSYAVRGYKDAMLEDEYKLHDYVFECIPEEGKRAVIAICPDEKPLECYIVAGDEREESFINGTAVIIQGFNTYYSAEFEYDGVYYKVETENASLEELEELLDALTSELPKESEDAAADANDVYMEAVSGEDLTDPSAEIFCGSYIDENGAYTVLLTEDTAENRALICGEIGIKESDAVWKTAAYTHKYLTELQSKISDAMVNKELPFVVASGVYDSLNRIKVRVTTKDENEISKVLALDTIGGAIEVEFTDGVFATTDLLAVKE